MSGRPLIAIDGELVLEKGPAVHLPTRYAEAVEEAGGMPFVLPPIRTASFVADLLDVVEGVLFAGGDDFDTEVLGLGPTHPAARPVPGAKQAFDLELARGALGRRIPCLGICYGMQLLALAEGSELLQHLPEDRPDAKEHGGGVEHEVRLVPGTKLRELAGVASLTVVSRHHQALAAAPPGWVVAAEDDEGLIEAIEYPAHPFALGVQWHPELPGSADPDGGNARLFVGLIEAAKRPSGPLAPLSG